MFSLAKFQVIPTAFGTAVRNVLLRIGVNESAASSNGDDFAVWPRPGGEPFVGLGPLLAVAGTASTPHPLFVGSRAATHQWCSAAAQLANAQLNLADIEARFNLVSSGKTLLFLAGTNEPTVADLLLLAAIKEQQQTWPSPTSRVEAPNLSKWVDKVIQSDALCKEFFGGGAAAVTATNAAATTSDDQQQNKAGQQQQQHAFDKGVAPTAAEIAARRAEKERLKKEKAAQQTTGAPPAATGQTAASQPPETGNSPAAAGATTTAGNKNNQPVTLDPNELDLRVGKIVSVAPHPAAQRLYVESIDLGEASGPRQIISGLVEHYKAEELNGQLCVVVCNMKPRKLQGTDSQGMVLCASTEKAVKIIQPPAGTAPGTAIVFGAAGAAAAAATTSSAAKAILSSNKMSQLLEPLNANELGLACWKDVPMSVGGQPVQSAIPGVPIK